MENTNTKKIEFYGGAIGPWIPVIVMICGMIIGTVIGGGGMARFAVITFIALLVGFLLAKDKKNFGQISFAGLKNPMLSILIIAFILATIMGQLLRQSGLINALIYVISSTHLSVGWLGVISFLVCALISTSCGTSYGSAAAVAPLMLPLASALGVDIGFVAGAIVAGAIFGDNLAPISDTTIGSALTQEAPVAAVVKTRLPYSLIAGGISMVLFAVIGTSLAKTGEIAVDLDAVNLKSLVMIVMPLLMIFLMKKGYDLVATLAICDIVGMILGLVTGCIPMAQMLSNEGPIGGGISGASAMLMYIMLLFQILEILNASGAFETMMHGLLKFCKTPRSGELAGMIMTAVTTAAAGGSSPAIIFCGPMVKNVAQTFNIEKTRGANILDGTSCGVSGLLPYGSCVMLCLSVAEGIAPAGFSFVNIIMYNFHSMLLLVLFFLSIMTGIGRRFNKAE